MSLEFNDNNFVKKLAEQMPARLEAAAIYFKGKVQEKLNQVQEEYIIYRGDKGVWYKGLNPAPPNEPPHRIRGDLHNSISHEMKGDVAQVGSNLDYAYYLEFGGHPFFRPTIQEEKETIKKIVATGSK